MHTCTYITNRARTMHAFTRSWFTCFIRILGRLSPEIRQIVFLKGYFFKGRREMVQRRRERNNRFTYRSWSSRFALRCSSLFSELFSLVSFLSYAFSIQGLAIKKQFNRSSGWCIAKSNRSVHHSIRAARQYNAAVPGQGGRDDYDPEMRMSIHRARGWKPYYPVGVTAAVLCALS